MFGGVQGRFDRAFTLIELLVVVSVIALLIALLMPALSATRNATRSTACLSNLRQLGIAMQTYTRDNQGWLPAGPADQLLYMRFDSATAAPEISREPRTGGGWRPVMETPWQWGGRRASWNYLQDEDGNPRAESQLRPLTRQIYRSATLDSPTPLFDCPTDRGVEFWDRPHAGAWKRDGLGGRPVHELVGNSYYVHLWGTAESGDANARDFKRRAGQVVLIYDAIFYYNYFTPKSPFLPDIPPAVRRKTWHSMDGAYNFLFLDGHAEQRRMHTLDPDHISGKGLVFAGYQRIMDYYR
ncbi:MAG TPA: DUF1559 domain-containing protein [Phycisphaerae bacterium]|nr:DUF1559 domain-containing protein [Phycisphaerae bacterium]HOJ76217.1 DUF1559 domain-containing protein [Phycisphaerae bacterium]HPP28891.1 DUF1559 domain-containing protein [Phycisphaerae bacterium]HPU25929.1 DUF1559 domain-containing protein [Phycisphaerae bacterium]HQA00335.1 DUF1559 domain-containing protein [Phycisphaerae bacterium]